MALKTLSLSSFDFSDTPTTAQHVLVRTGPGEDDFANIYLGDFRTFITADVNARIDALAENSGGGSGPSIWPVARTLSLSGPISGSVSFDGSANFTLSTTIANDSLSIAMVSGLQPALDAKLTKTDPAVSAAKLTTARTVTLSGVIAGSTTFDGSADLTLTTSIADGALSIAKTSGLQTTLDLKAPLDAPIFTGQISGRGGYLDLWASSSGYAPRFFLRDQTGKLLSGFFQQRSGTDTPLAVRRYAEDGTAVVGEVLIGNNLLKYNGFDIWHSGNFDPTSSSYLASPSIQYAANAGVNCNNFTAGTKVVVHSTNANTPGPSSTFWYVETLMTGTSAVNLVQRAHSITGDEFYLRYCTSNAWGPWRRQWNSSNFDPTSKLNTDATATAANRWATARSIALTGVVTGTVSIDGSSDVSLPTAIADGSLSIAKTSGLQTALDSKITRNASGLAGNAEAVGTFATPSASGFYRVSGDEANAPVTAPTLDWDVVHHQSANGDQSQIVLSDVASGVSRAWFRIKDDATNWGGWREFWHSGNLDISQYVQNTRAVTAGIGLTGGGTLSTDQTISMGTPSTVSGSTANSVSAGTHTHALSANLKAWDGLTTASKWDTASATAAGLGSNTGVVLSDVNSPANGNATFFSAPSTAANAPSAIQNWAGVYMPYSSSAGSQVAVSPTDPRLFFRGLNASGAAYGWKEVWHTANFDPTTKLNANATAVAASKLATARNVTLSGVVAGTGSFDGTADLVISTTIADGTLSIAKTSGLQTALDAKANLAGADFTGTVTTRNGRFEVWANTPTQQPYMFFRDSTGKLYAGMGFNKTGDGTFSIRKYNSDGTALDGLLNFAGTDLTYNGYTVWNSNNLYTNVKSITSYGAINDGRDNTVAIQAAIDSGAEVLLFPAGTWLHTGLIARSNQKWIGAGMNRTVLTFAQANIASPAGVNGIRSVANITDFTMEDIGLMGNVDYQTSNDSTGQNLFGLSFRAGSVRNVSINRCRFTMWGTNDRQSGGGLIISPNTGSNLAVENVTVRDCVFQDNGNVSGLYISGVSQYVNLLNNISVLGCRFTLTNDYGRQNMVYILGDTSLTGTDVTVDGNSFEFSNAADCAIELNYLRNWSASGNKIRITTNFGAATGILIRGNCSDGNICNNTMINQGTGNTTTAGIGILNFGSNEVQSRIVIANNTIVDWGDCCLNVSNVSSYIQVTGNVFSTPVKNADTLIRIAACSYSTFSNNILSKAQSAFSIASGNTGINRVNIRNNTIDDCGGSSRWVIDSPTANQNVQYLHVVNNTVGTAPAGTAGFMNTPYQTSTGNVVSKNYWVTGAYLNTSNLAFVQRWDRPPTSNGALLTGYRYSFSQGALQFQGPFPGTAQAPGQFTIGANLDGSVPDVAFGDAIAVGFSGSLAGVQVFGYVEAANKVRINVANGTPGALDVPAGTWYVHILKRT